MLLKLLVFIFFATAHTIFAVTLGPSSCGKRNWQCNDGSCIRSILKCDGQADCLDRSDESEETCSSNVCSNGMFQCGYGACVNSEGLCNGEEDCVDGSDEDKNLCDKAEPTPSAPAVHDCKLPPYPKHGNFSVITVPMSIRDSNLGFDVWLTVSCESGYSINAFPVILCRNGIWKKSIPQCLRTCQLNKHSNLNYYCPSKKYSTQECEDVVPSGVTVITECKDRDYFSPNNLKCSEGIWDRAPVCKPECGKVTQEPVKLTLVGDRAVYNFVPWHATFYSKLTRSQVCGGSLISATVVVSAAHCFWDNAVGLLPAPTYRVIVGTIHRQSTIDIDTYQQHRDVNEVQIPNSFDGTVKSLEYDIALVTVATPFQFSAFVTPVCLDFDSEFSRRQLSENIYGRFALWDEATDLLKPLDLPYVPAATCAETYSAISQLNITSDQICAGELNGIKLDRSSAGTGLAFANNHGGVERFYLRGVASVPSTNNEPIIFTQILKHKMFIGSKIVTV